MIVHKYEIGDGRNFEIVHLSRGDQHIEGPSLYRGPAVLWVEIFADGERNPYQVRGIEPTSAPLEPL